MNKKYIGVIAAVATLIGIAVAVWGVSSHEHTQDAGIKNAYSLAELAMQKSQLAIDQQRVAWLEERIWEMEQKYGCRESGINASCSSSVWRTYQKYLKEYEYLIEKISEQTSK